LQPIATVTLDPRDPEGTVDYTASTFNGAAVLPAASISGYNPLYDVQQLYGLTSAPYKSNANGKFLQSSNGSNPAFGFKYLLAPSDKLYAWLGNISDTLASAPVADFTTGTYFPYNGVNVYNNPALLYAATQPSAPAVNTDVSTPGKLLLFCQPDDTRTFRVTL